MRNEFPSYTFYPNAEIRRSGSTQIEDERVLLTYSGGTTTPWTFFSIENIQILTRSVNFHNAEYIAQLIYNELHGRFGLILPSVTIGSITYDAIQTGQISAIQDPFSLGVDDNGRLELSTNYEFIFTKEVR